jgi:hypothetical protein
LATNVNVYEAMFIFDSNRFARERLRLAHESSANVLVVACAAVDNFDVWWPDTHGGKSAVDMRRGKEFLCIEDNVVLATYRINAMKRDATLAELREWMPSWHKRLAEHFWDSPLSLRKMR